jgi:hypothetical protein
MVKMPVLHDLWALNELAGGDCTGSLEKGTPASVRLKHFSPLEFTQVWTKRWGQGMPCCQAQARCYYDHLIRVSPSPSNVSSGALVENQQLDFLPHSPRHHAAPRPSSTTIHQLFCPVDLPFVVFGIGSFFFFGLSRESPSLEPRPRLELCA